MPHQTTPDTRRTYLAALTLRRDEPGQLARAFEYMLSVLGRREQDLQQAVQVRTQSLEQEMRDRQIAQDALRTYSHAINHDLRNLVMGISSVIQGIQFKALKTSRATVDDVSKCSTNPPRPILKGDPAPTPTPISVDTGALTVIQTSCDRQLKLMDSLMEVQSADVWRMALQPERIDLRQLVEGLGTAYQPKFEARQASFEHRIPTDLPKVHVDPCQIKRVFENLMDNALKHNSPGVTVTVRAAWNLAIPAQIRCCVSDNGAGIDPAKGQALFQLYARGQAANQAPGCGLGLYICKQIVEAHGGAIGVEMAAPQGAEFWFTLPRVARG